MIETLAMWAFVILGIWAAIRQCNRHRAHEKRFCRECGGIGKVFDQQYPYGRSCPVCRGN